MARAHKLPTLDFRQISYGVNKHMDSISIVWVKNNDTGCMLSRDPPQTVENKPRLDID